MVCIFCLLPLFIIPIVNALPLLFDYIMGKVYAVLGWEYRKPERAPPACPYKPSAKMDGATDVPGMGEPSEQAPASKPVSAGDVKQD